MESTYKLIMKFAKPLAGDNRIRIFTIQKALLNVLGFDWWKGGINLPLPSVLKFIFYPACYPLLMMLASFLTIKSSIEIEANNDFLFTKKVNGFIVSMTFLASTLKVIYFRIIKTDVKRLIEMCENMGQLDVESGPVGLALRSSVFYAILLLSNAGTWTVYYLSAHNDFPFSTDYPWAQDNVWGFGGAFFVNFFSALFCAVSHTLVDTTFPMVIGVTWSHLDHLKESLKGIGKGYWADSVKLENAVNLHVKLLVLTKQMVGCFSKLFIAQSVYTVLHACILIFAMTKVSDKFAVTMSSVPMLSAAYVQLYMYCSYGQSLTSRFDELTFASYDNEWYRCEVRTRKALILFTESCKRPVSLKGFGNIKASLANYLHSLQESISYYIVLKTLTADGSDTN